ncbi:MAG: peptidase S10 [Gemmatimonadota bacterium]|nr:peptidase S10 [Gemmatimonadota bacterium]
MQLRALIVGIASIIASLPNAAAAQRPATPGRPGTPAAPGAPAVPGGRAERPDSAALDSAGVPALERISVTHHTAMVGGHQIAYTAHAGTLVLRDDEGKPDASVFFIAYTRDGENATSRPLTFFFNGGPGSASLWLDMGIMSPMHPEMGPNGSQPAPPYNLVDNANSPLDVTDLVQIDAMMTGYTRPAKGIKATAFTGAPNDIKMFGTFIREYLDKYHRWKSPKYLFGESYGTFRSAGLASELQSAEGIELNGIMLLGTVLDFQYIQPSPTNDIAYAAFLPTFTATAWYHKKLPASIQGETLEQVVQQSRDYAFGDYLGALAKGNTLTAAQRAAVAQRLAQLTGVSQQFIMNTNLRIDAGTFRTELLRDQREMLGRYDSRMIGINGNASSTRQDYDPSDVAPTGAFMSAFMRYLHDDLGYSSDLQYYMGGHTGRWDYSALGSEYPSEVEALRTAMAKDPYLHVMVGAGYYDTATPFANAEYTFNHLGFDKTYSDRVEFKYYESGHMAYLNQASARQLKSDIASFIAATVHGGAVSR